MLELRFLVIGRGRGTGIESYVSMLRGTLLLTYAEKRGEGGKNPKI